MGDKMASLNTAELQTLKTIANQDRSENLCRTTLEKLFRLDLIEPCAEGVCLTGVGKKALSK